VELVHTRADASQLATEASNLLGALYVIVVQLRGQLIVLAPPLGVHAGGQLPLQRSGAVTQPLDLADKSGTVPPGVGQRCSAALPGRASAARP